MPLSARAEDRSSEPGLAAGPGGAGRDPYVILDCHVAALGGWERLKAIRSRHAKGLLTIEGAGLSGTVEDWESHPAKKRQEIDLQIFRQVSGDNGEAAWRTDPNGKLVLQKDPATLKERELQLRRAANEHLERGSKVFTVSYARLDTAGGRWCHVLKTANTINSVVSYDFYDTTSCRLVQTITQGPASESRTRPGDYREVDGVLVPFRVENLEMPSGQRTTVQLSAVELNVPVDPALFEPPAGQTRDFRFPPGLASVEVPFDFTELHIYIPLTIGGKTMPWVLDSGAGASVIEAEFAREIGLETQGKVVGQGISSTVDVAFATLPPFDLNGLAFEAQKVVAIALNDIFRKTGGFEIGGILGYDFLSRLVTKVDYANERLTFFDPDSFRYAGPGVVLQTPLTRSNMLQVEIKVDERLGGPWNLDLGAGGLEFFYPYAEENGLLERPGIRRMGLGAGGGMMSTVARFEKLEFAGYTLDNVRIGIPRAKGTGVFASREITGNAGNELFRHFVLYLDYARGQVIVEKGADFDRDFPADRSGLGLMLDREGRLEAVTVSEGTPAAEAGIHEGDIVISVDGRSVKEAGGIIAVREMLRASPGTKRNLELEREGKRLEATVVLREL